MQFNSFYLIKLSSKYELEYEAYLHDQLNLEL